MRALVLMIVLASAGVAKADFLRDLALAGEERSTHRVRYDPAYVRIPYPMGDVPADTGVCSDVLIRALRAVGVDLQRLVHEDMRRNFGRYPRIWGLKRPDPNIDHRRVPNIETFLTRQGAALPVRSDPAAFEPGDIVSWRLPGNLPHIGIVTTRVRDGRPLIAHNIGAGPRVEDMLFDYPIHGHFRWQPRN